MEATVKVINRKRGTYAAEIDATGEFVIFRLLNSSEPEIDDRISHPDFYRMGYETFQNLTQGCSMAVSVENIYGPSLVRQQGLIQ
jgi:hypothetical protein